MTTCAAAVVRATRRRDIRQLWRNSLPHTVVLSADDALLLRFGEPDVDRERPTWNTLIARPAILIHRVQLHRNLMFVLVEQEHAVAIFTMSSSRNADFVSKAVMVIS